MTAGVFHCLGLRRYIKGVLVGLLNDLSFLFICFIFLGSSTLYCSFVLNIQQQKGREGQKVGGKNAGLTSGEGKGLEWGKVEKDRKRRCA